MDACQIAMEGAGAMVALAPIFAPLFDVAKAILRATKDVGRKVWSDFGAHVYEAVRRIISALDLEQFNSGSGLRHHFKELEAMLSNILSKVSNINNRPWIHRFLFRLWLDDYLVISLRQELDDCLSLFQISALALMSSDLSEVLSKVRRIYIQSGLTPDHGIALASAEGSRRWKTTLDEAPKVEANRGTALCTEDSADEQSQVAGLTSLGPAVEATVLTDTTKQLDLNKQISIARYHVQSCRQSIQKRPEDHIQLAVELRRLSQLLKAEGQLQEALSLCQEANDLYHCAYASGVRARGSLSQKY